MHFKIFLPCVFTQTSVDMSSLIIISLLWRHQNLGAKTRPYEKVIVKMPEKSKECFIGTICIVIYFAASNIFRSCVLPLIRSFKNNLSWNLKRQKWPQIWEHHTSQNLSINLSTQLVNEVRLIEYDLCLRNTTKQNASDLRADFEELFIYNDV